jgi:hypothetical protein
VCWSVLHRCHCWKASCAVKQNLFVVNSAAVMIWSLATSVLPALYCDTFVCDHVSSTTWCTSVHEVAHCHCVCYDVHLWALAYACCCKAHNSIVVHDNTAYANCYMLCLTGINSMNMLLMFDTQFLYGTGKPTLAVLYEDNREARHLRTYAVRSKCNTIVVHTISYQHTVT